ncbi:MAG: hypothetical protein P8046_14125 [Anaerolineales bacterium]
MEIENTQIVTSEEKPIDQKTKIGLIIGGIILLALFIGAVIFLLNSEKTPIIRDIFVILLGQGNHTNFIFQQWDCIKIPNWKVGFRTH